ncbi:hypothetical protein [Confluentibacter citreus]|uniref:hypothetical protein n=1 Tax=Confluentibacter citreus TaxID=2007307 RepID=UPI000C284326|nr:hypothetical protein [Confluentibacter citreus]
MKTILIPTDFTADSLSILKNALNSEQDEKVNIILGYGKRLSWSISDLLFYSTKSVLKELEDNEFTEAKEIIMNKYSSKINSLRVELFHGFNQNAFNAFIEGNQINYSVIPESDDVMDYKYKQGFDIVPFIKKSSLYTETVSYAKEYATSTQGSSLFKLLTS